MSVPKGAELKVEELLYTSLEHYINGSIFSPTSFSHIHNGYDSDDEFRGLRTLLGTSFALCYTHSCTRTYIISKLSTRGTCRSWLQTALIHERKLTDEEHNYVYVYALYMRTENCERISRALGSDYTRSFDPRDFLEW